MGEVLSQGTGISNHDVLQISYNFSCQVRLHKADYFFSYFTISGPSRWKEFLMYNRKDPNFENALLKEDGKRNLRKCLLKLTLGNGIFRPPLEERPEAT